MSPALSPLSPWCSPCSPHTCSLLFPGPCERNTDTVLHDTQSDLCVFPCLVRQTPGSLTPSTRCRAAAEDTPGGWRLCPPNRTLPVMAFQALSPLHLTPAAPVRGCHRRERRGSEGLGDLLQRVAGADRDQRPLAAWVGWPGWSGGLPLPPPPSPQEAVTPGAPGCIVGREWPCSWGKRHVV